MSKKFICFLLIVLIGILISFYASAYSAVSKRFLEDDPDAVEWCIKAPEEKPGIADTPRPRPSPPKKNSNEKQKEEQKVKEEENTKE